MFRAVSKFLTEVRGATSNKVYDVTKEAVLWDFRKEGAAEQWDCITDKDVHGFSQASLEPNGKGMVHVSHIATSISIASICCFFFFFGANIRFGQTCSELL